MQQFWREWVQLPPPSEGETKGYHWDKQAALEARTARQAANKAAKKAAKAARGAKCPSGLQAPPVFAGKQG